ncbi:MAG TPA: protein kinase [Terriglobales bacterium]|jgi:tetratricopeptide (TPR) repeat protein
MAEPYPVPENFASTPPDLSGSTIGRFRVVERLGGGGMGEVYRAEDPKLKRTVALKRLAPQLRSDIMHRRRLLEEAERASRFADTHVAALYDVLEENGEIFLVMEYIEGETLRQRLRRPLALDQFFDIAIQCAKALAAAHQRDIVHCDIKPENIMLTTSGQVKVLDFGVAKYLPRSGQDSTVDRSGTMAGTPAYMSPEVLLEKVPDGRADIFSLGVVFYEALTGQHPFLASSFVATTDRIRNETPAPIRIFNRNVPVALEGLVSRALAKDPARRHQSAGELLDDIQTVQTGLTPSRFRHLLPVPTPPAPSRWVIIPVMVALVVAAVFFFLHRAQSKPLLTERGWVLIADLDASGGQAVPAEGVREGLTIGLQQSRYVNVFPRSRAYETLERMQKQNVPRIDETLGREICRRENLQVLLAGTVVGMGDETQVTLRAINPYSGEVLVARSDHFRNDQFFDKVDGLARSIREALGESIAYINKDSRPLAKVTTKSLAALQLYSQAKSLVDQGKDDQALAPLQGALQLDPNFAMAHLLLGGHYLSVANKNEKAVAQFKIAYDLRAGVTDREQRLIEADYYGVQERYEEAAQSLNVLLSFYPDDPEARLTLAQAYYALGQVDKAIDQLREVIKLNVHGAQAYEGSVWLLAQRNHSDEALAVYKSALEAGIDTSALHWAAGLAFLSQDKVDLARDQFRTLLSRQDYYRDMGELYLARTDAYEGMLSKAKTQLEARVRKDQSSTQKGVQPFRRYLLGRVALLLNDLRTARLQADAILAMPVSDRQYDDVVAAGTLYARAGEITLAKKALSLIEVANAEVPSALNKSYLLKLTGEISLADGRTAEAVDNFLAASMTYPDIRSRCGLARAYVARREWPQAAQQWQQVVDAKGEILAGNNIPTDYVLAHLELARCLRAMNRDTEARLNYHEFLRLWRQGDELPIRRAAESELKKLPSGPALQEPIEKK